jgi:hypothetical protein
MRLAAEGQFVDIRRAASGPFVDVVDLAPISGNVATWVRAAAIFGVQDHALIR